MIRTATLQEVNRWDQLIQEAQAHPYQSRTWAEHKQRFSFPIIHYLIFEHHSASYPFTVLSKKIPLVGWISYCPKGPSLGNQTDESLWRTFTKEMTEIILATRDISLLIIEPPVEMNTLQLEKFGYLKSMRDIQPRATIWVDLNKDEEALLMSFTPKMRYNIRLAQRKGVVTKIAKGTLKEFEILYNLLEQTSKRAGFSRRTKTEYFDYWQQLIAAKMGTIIFAYYDNQVICGAFLIKFGQYAYYKDGGSLSTNRNIMAPHLLQFEAMRWARSQNCVKYDLLGVPPSNAPTNHLFSSLLQFKQGFNRTITEYVGCYDLILKPAGKLFHKYQLRYNGILKRLGKDDIY